MTHPSGWVIPLGHPDAKKTVLEPLGLQLPVIYPIVAVKLISGDGNELRILTFVKTESLLGAILADEPLYLNERDWAMGPGPPPDLPSDL